MTRPHRLSCALLAALLAVAATVPRAEAITGVSPRPVDLDAMTVRNGDVESGFDAVVAHAPAIVHFWATWCVPCRDELPAVARFREALAEQGLAERLILVSVDRFGFDRVEAFLDAELGLPSLPSWQDARGNAGTVFRLFGYPGTVLIDAEGREVARHAGPLDWDSSELRALLVEHLTAGR